MLFRRMDAKGLQFILKDNLMYYVAGYMNNLKKLYLQNDEVTYHSSFTNARKFTDMKEAIGAVTPSEVGNSFLHVYFAEGKVDRSLESAYITESLLDFSEIAPDDYYFAFGPSDEMDVFSNQTSHPLILYFRCEGEFRNGAAIRWMLDENDGFEYIQVTFTISKVPGLLKMTRVMSYLNAVARGCNFKKQIPTPEVVMNDLRTLGFREYNYDTKRIDEWVDLSM
ncbi:MAG: hypothetical protein EOP48_04985 [Sphingobacteriales bacterium]|nr:MAG: hypothetical protein EOP48_04985 [Sphingobacteriales bacterium]